MTACATERMLPATVTVGNLFLPLPDTDFREYLDEIEREFSSEEVWKLMEEENE